MNRAVMALRDVTLSWITAHIAAWAVSIASRVANYWYKGAAPFEDTSTMENHSEQGACARLRKRKAPPSDPAISEECVREIRGFLRLGVPGVRELGVIWPALLNRYHPGDRQGWADSCNAAFGGSGRDIQRRLEECEWELNRLEPSELWFMY